MDQQLLDKSMEEDEEDVDLVPGALLCAPCQDGEHEGCLANHWTDKEILGMRSGEVTAEEICICPHCHREA